MRPPPSLPRPATWQVPEGGLLADEQATREMAEKVAKAAKEHGIDL